MMEKISILVFNYISDKDEEPDHFNISNFEVWEIVLIVLAVLCVWFIGLWFNDYVRRKK